MPSKDTSMRPAPHRNATAFATFIGKQKLTLEHLSEEERKDALERAEIEYALLHEPEYFGH
jgi:hypothetical protein